MRIGQRVEVLGGGLGGFELGVVEKVLPQPAPWSDLVKIRIRGRLSSWTTGWIATRNVRPLPE